MHQQNYNLPINKIICGDAVEVLFKFPLASIDLVVTSPPYDNLRDYNNYVFNFKGIVLQLKKVLKTGGVIVWVVGDATIKGSETGTSFRQALYFKKLGFNLHDTMIYSKNGFANPSCNRYHQTFEYMFIFSKGPPKTFNPIKDRKNLNKRRGGFTKRQKNGTMKLQIGKTIFLNEFGQRWNIWQYEIGLGKVSSNKIAHQHPAIFPEKLAIDHILSWSNPGDLILDPMCGSGTTCVAAKQLNRRYIGIDISKEYCNIAKERLELWKD